MPLYGAFIMPHPPVIIPEVGGARSRDLDSTLRAFEAITDTIAALKPNTILVTTPHSVMYYDYIHISPGEEAKGDFSAFGAPEVKFSVSYDSRFAEKLGKIAESCGIRAGSEGEKNKKLDHGTMVPLYFLSARLKDFKIVRIGLSGLSYTEHYKLGKCIAKTVKYFDEKPEKEKRYIFIASGDLSHKLRNDGPYGYAEQGPVFDRKVTEAIAEGDFGRFFELDEDFCEEAAECGLRSFIIMAGALDGRKVESKLLSYEGPFGVGYAVASFISQDETGCDPSRQFDLLYEREIAREAEIRRNDEDKYVGLARSSLEHYIKTGKMLTRPDNLLPVMTGKRAGVFVSLKKEGRLRGCIGSIEPTAGCIADEIIQNAVSAGTRDPRFDPVGKEELPFLLYSVDVLGEPEPIASENELDVKKYGVIVTAGSRRGLLLPDLEGVGTPARQVEIALQKAGIAPGSRYSMYRFTVTRHSAGNAEDKES